MRLRLFLVVNVLAATLAACGQPTTAKPLSEGAYKRAVTRVCARTYKAYEKISEAAEKAPADTDTVRVAAARSDAVSRLYRDQIPRLRRLIPPKRLAARVAAEIAQMRRVSSDYQRQAAELRTRPDQQRELSLDQLEGLSSISSYVHGDVTWVAYLNLDPYCWPLP